MNLLTSMRFQLTSTLSTLQTKNTATMFNKKRDSVLTATMDALNSKQAIYSHAFVVPKRIPDVLQSSFFSSTNSSTQPLHGISDGKHRIRFRTCDSSAGTLIGVAIFTISRAEHDKTLGNENASRHPSLLRSRAQRKRHKKSNANEDNAHHSDRLETVLVSRAFHALIAQSSQRKALFSAIRNTSLWLAKRLRLSLTQATLRVAYRTRRASRSVESFPERTHSTKSNALTFVVAFDEELGGERSCGERGRRHEGDARRIRRDPFIPIAAVRALVVDVKAAQVLVAAGIVACAIRSILLARYSPIERRSRYLRSTRSLFLTITGLQRRLVALHENVSLGVTATLTPMSS